MPAAALPPPPPPEARRRRAPLDLWAFAQAWTALLAADLGLRALPFARMARVPRVSPPEPRGAPPEEATVGRLVWATAAAARHHLYAMPCLPRALALRWLLARHGIAAELRIGVARRAGELAAHAWVEWRGRAVGERPGIADELRPLEAP
jgi:hypothetical protein